VNSFALPIYDLETVRENTFFLCYAGKGGYNTDAIGRMFVEDFNWHVQRLIKQLKQETDAIKNSRKR
jgi:hypothetical protein